MSRKSRIEAGASTHSYWPQLESQPRYWPSPRIVRCCVSGTYYFACLLKAFRVPDRECRFGVNLSKTCQDVIASSIRGHRRGMYPRSHFERRGFHGRVSGCLTSYQPYGRLEYATQMRFLDLPMAIRISSKTCISSRQTSGDASSCN